MSICDLKVGESATIDFLSGEEKLIKRLLSLGCTQGTEILLKNTAPLGDPIVVNLRGFSLAIRKKDAKGIFVK
ncbi:MAG TPA: ferrous iron transport protein A [Clostridiaceae bacterium]